VNPARIFRVIQKRLIRAPLLAVGLFLLPWAYMAYCRFVWLTSRKIDRMKDFRRWGDEHDGLISALWHEEVFTVAFCYRDFHGHTLASVGDAGEAITRLLQRCNFTVFRGGSAVARSRYRDVLRPMIEHMKENRKVIYGITVDGSMGPRYVMKPGVVAIARACNRPVAVVRTWYKRMIRLPTWDRMAIPLPFNVIVREARGPFWPPTDGTDESLEAFRLDMQRRLRLLTKESYEEHGHPVPQELLDLLAADAAEKVGEGEKKL